MLQICWWYLRSHCFPLTVTCDNAEAKCAQDGWPLAQGLQYKDMVDWALFNAALFFLAAPLQRQRRTASVGCFMCPSVCSEFNKALSGGFFLILWIFPCSSQVEVNEHAAGDCCQSESDFSLDLDDLRFLFFFFFFSFFFFSFFLFFFLCLSLHSEEVELLLSSSSSSLLSSSSEVESSRSCFSCCILSLKNVHENPF